MENIFLKTVNLSITTGWFILALLIFRPLIKRLPRAFSCILWGLVGIRLVLPFSIRSILSLIPSSETLPSDILYTQAPTINSGIPYLNSTVNPIISSSLSPNPADSANPMQIITFIVSNIWISGILILVIYAIFSYLKLYFITKECIKTKDNIRICDNISTPFILGIIKPKIFIPSTLSDEDYKFVIPHEQAHIKRLDHLWKPIGFLLLTVYWFNPIVWVAYILLCRDIETACDEKVIRSLDSYSRKAYSLALVNCSARKKLIRACPLAFGENGVKSRIKNVLSYKKPTFWILIISVIVSAIAVLCFMTNPTDIKISEIDEPTLNMKVAFQNVESVSITSYDNTYVLTEKDSINKLITQLKNVKVNHTPIETRADDRDKTHRITINGDIFCFNKTYTKLWINTGLKPSFTYNVSNPKTVEKIFDELDFDGVTSSLMITDSGSLIEGVSISVEGFELNADKPYITVRYHNKTDKEFMYSEQFELLFLENDTFYSCAKDEVYFNALGYILNPYSSNTHTYNLSPFDLSREGVYRMRIPYTENKYFWIDFNISNSKKIETLCDIYGFRGSPDYLMPTIALSTEDDTFSFRYSGFSSYLAMGKYTINNNELILTPNDSFKNKYVFTKTDNGYIFNANKSSEIPKYKYGEYENAISPVPDGALFELFATDIKSSAIIDGINYDIDNDGKNEHCALFYGPTMGIFSFKFLITEDRKTEYHNSFCFEHSDIYFKEENGELKIGVKSTKSSLSDIDIELKNGKIILSSGGERLNYLE